MFEQWHPQRGQARQFPDGRKRLVGSLRVGLIFYPQDAHIGPFGPGRHFSPVRRHPWIIEAWLNRELGAAGKDADGKYYSRMMAGGHLAVIRCLADRRRTATMADWLIRMHEELDCVKEDANSPYPGIVPPPPAPVPPRAHKPRTRRGSRTTPRARGSKV